MKDVLQPSAAELETRAAHKLFLLKWPNGFECPRCGYGRYYLIQSRRTPLFECVACRHQTSLTVGTIMEGSRTPLSKWFMAIDLVARLSKGTSAVELAATIQVTYKTAWLILHKIRYALGHFDDSRQLSGGVRMNNGIYGRPYNSTIYRHPEEHPLLAAAAVTDSDTILQVKIKPIPAEHCDGNVPTASARQSFARRHIKPDATIHGLRSSYAVNRHPLIRQVCLQVSRWLNNTFHGLGGKHLTAYLDEYCCRLNLAAAAVGSLSDQLAAICTRHPRITYAALISKPYTHVHHPSYYIGRNQQCLAFPSYSPYSASTHEVS